jgi:hypothetical protein
MTGGPRVQGPSGRPKRGGYGLGQRHGSRRRQWLGHTHPFCNTVDVAHVQQLCEGLQCTPYDLFGAEIVLSSSSNAPVPTPRR